jgi:hypothetical protein
MGSDENRDREEKDWDEAPAEGKAIATQIALPTHRDA